MFAELHAALRQADEDYLIGLSNKGTVKRAKKDLEGLTPAAQEEDQAVQVRLGEEVCTIRAPLGDSLCTCPAPGMCRHRIAAILWLKRQTDQDAPAEEKPADLSPLLEVPVDQLRRAIGAKAFHALVFRLGRDGLPPIQEGSILQVELPWENAAVKLLLPLEHSACTCRSRELCRHKAAALLAYQLMKKRHTLEELAGQATPGESRWDLEQAAAAAQAVRELTAELLDTGLSRLSPSAPDSAQRLSALCHTAALPRLENGLRSLGTLLERALDRSAAFRTEDLLLRLARLEHLARKLEQVQDGNQIPELAGTFREEYAACPALTLTLVGERAFHTDSGYAGVVYYFWELKQRQWYTYTFARPTFYDKRDRRRHSHIPAPWGLDCQMDQLYGLRLTLERGKATRDRRLSSSEDCRAMAGDSLQPWEALPEEVCWTDFAKLFQALEPHLLEGAETDRTVLVRPSRWVPQKFDKTAQLFRMLLLDTKGRVLPLEVRFSAQSKALVELLEKIAQTPQENTAFLGLLRLEGEGLTFYPIEYYSDWGCAG